ncbi:MULTISPECIES: cyclase family protein [Myroides]|uniref:cyclase family protein n=1 Tax=Myroides odoratus TaxID=256 RepID=UPI0024BF20CB|nr:cyclase family protein [Myroides sp. mNGS23_01]WHT40480.1 cyclase family protein [Myroides sp. mNGS23_01]
MKATLSISNQTYAVDFSQPIDISIPLTNTDENPIAWYLDKPSIEPVRMGDWVGKVSEGQSSTNFNTIAFNPHGHGTHTECLGHITREFYSINDTLKTFVFLAQVLTVTPERQDDGDAVITLTQIQRQWNEQEQTAVVLRTLPNQENKKHSKYSHTNPPYLAADAAAFLREKGIKHLLIDLPSVDKEKDGGELAAHKAFWNVKNVNQVNDDAQFDATITELIYVADEVVDGMYILNIQIASFVNDASPSKPILYQIL